LFKIRLVTVETVNFVLSVVEYSSRTFGKRVIVSSMQGIRWKKGRKTSSPCLPRSVCARSLSRERWPPLIDPVLSYFENCYYTRPCLRVSTNDSGRAIRAIRV